MIIWTLKYFPPLLFQDKKHKFEEAHLVLIES